MVIILNYYLTDYINFGQNIQYVLRLIINLPFKIVIGYDYIFQDFIFFMAKKKYLLFFYQLVLLMESPSRQIFQPNLKIISFLSFIIGIF